MGIVVVIKTLLWSLETVLGFKINFHKSIVGGYKTNPKLLLGLVRNILMSIFLSISSKKIL